MCSEVAAFIPAVNSRRCGRNAVDSWMWRGKVFGLAGKFTGMFSCVGGNVSFWRVWLLDIYTKDSSKLAVEAALAAGGANIDTLETLAW